MENNEMLQALGHRVRADGLVLGSFILAIWLLEGIDWVVGGSLDQYGIIPRQLIGLRGILVAPLLHGGFSHVAANTIPFLVLGWLVLLRGRRVFLIVCLVTLLVGGLATWAIAPSASVHIGASGLIFGFFGYLLFRGYFERSWQAILLAGLVLLIYGGMLFGVLPTSSAVSWQMHLFGFLGGCLAAYLLTRYDTIRIGKTDPQI